MCPDVELPGTYVLPECSGVQPIEGSEYIQRVWKETAGMLYQLLSRHLKLTAFLVMASPFYGSLASQALKTLFPLMQETQMLDQP